MAHSSIEHPLIASLDDVRHAEARAGATGSGGPTIYVIAPHGNDPRWAASVPVMEAVESSPWWQGRLIAPLAPVGDDLKKGQSHGAIGAIVLFVRRLLGREPFEFDEFTGPHHYEGTFNLDFGSGVVAQRSPEPSSRENPLSANVT